MKRSAMQWLSITAVAAALVAGCAGPQRRPAPGKTNVPQTNPSALTNPAPHTSTTTGVSDACAVALGNVSGRVFTTGSTIAAGTPGAHTANGVLIGNVAVVSLPHAAAAPATPAAPAAPATPGASRAGTTATGTGIGRATPLTRSTAPAAPTPGTPTSPGSTTTTPGMTMGMDVSALDRIRTACDKVVDIRVVNSEADRTRLGDIAASIRRGEPVTHFMADLTRIAQGATSAGAGRNAHPAATVPAVPTTPTPAAPVRPGAPMPRTMTR